MDILCNNIKSDGIGLQRSDWQNFRECQDIVLNGQVIWVGNVLSLAVKSQIYTEYAANPTLAEQVWKAANAYAKAHPAMIETINANPTWYWGDFIYFYQQVEWIYNNQTGGCPKILFTGTNYSIDDELEIIWVTTYKGRYSGGSYAFNIDGKYLSCSQGKYSIDSNTKSEQSTFSPSINQHSVIKIVNRRNSSELFIDGAKYLTSTQVRSSVSRSVQIYNSSLYSIYAYTHSLTKKINGVTIHELHPCYNKTTQSIGLFDLVTGDMHTNAGTGTFTKGADV